MNKIPNNPFVLIDGSSYLFRAFYALPALTASNDQQTGAIHGVINMLRKLISRFEPRYMAVVFDSKEKNFRHEKYPLYKANREKMPNELAEQILPLQELIQALGIKVIVIPGVEADDVIGTLAKQANNKELFTVISTGDKDLAQLVNDSTVLINTMNNTILDAQGVIDKFSVNASQIVDYLTLTGDPVDNIPGVPNVGPKTAVKWIEQYKTLDSVVAHADEITGKAGENLRTSLSLLPLYKELTTIKTDVYIPCSFEELLMQKQDDNKLKTLLNKLEFHKLAQELNCEEDYENEHTKKQYETILTKQQFNEWLDKLSAAQIIAIDTETTSLDYLNAELVGISFSVGPHCAAYVPISHDYEGVPVQLEKQYVLNKIKTILENNKISKIGHNLKYDFHIFANYDIRLEGQLYDTMLESYILESVGSRHDLATLSKKYLNQDAILFEELAGKGVKQKTFNQIPIEQAAPYSAEDADFTLQLHDKLWQKLKDIPELQKVFVDIEMKLLPVLVDMERKGVLIDSKQLEKQSIKIEQKLYALQIDAFKLAKEEFNLNSPKQLQEIFFEKLGLPVLHKTPTGQPSTAEPVLQELALDFPLPKLVLEYRSLSKLKSTYTDKLPMQIDAKTQRIHTSYHQSVTSTGRLSSTDPNLQNIPIRTEIGKKIRNAFIAQEGNKILSADYSQIELRIMAHLSEDPVLIKAFNDGIDIHKITASEVFGIDINNVSTEQRRRAKAINFGLLYGMSAFGLSKQLDINRKDAEQYIDFYFARFPGVKKFIEHTKDFAIERGYVETLFGRRLYLPDIKSKNTMQRKAAERAAINAPMQGGQADLIKKAMIDIHEWKLNRGIDFSMIMQVHDELIFEVPIEHIEQIKENIIKLMSGVAKLKVELSVEVGIGDNWGEAH